MLQRQWTFISAFGSAVTVCSQLCTNSSAGEGLGGTAGGGFDISTTGGAGVCFGAWSGTFSSTLGFDFNVAGFFRSSAPRLMETEAVCFGGWEGIGPFCRGGEMGEGEPVVWVLQWPSAWEFRWTGGSGIVTGVRLRDEIFRACVLEADALRLLLSFVAVEWLTCWTALALLSE